jgi:hypothetical protein
MTTMLTKGDRVRVSGNPHTGTVVGFRFSKRHGQCALVSADQPALLIVDLPFRVLEKI